MQEYSPHMKFLPYLTYSRYSFQVKPVLRSATPSPKHCSSKTPSALGQNLVQGWKYWKSHGRCMHRLHGETVRKKYFKRYIWKVRIDYCSAKNTFQNRAHLLYLFLLPRGIHGTEPEAAGTGVFSKSRIHSFGHLYNAVGQRVQIQVWDPSNSNIQSLASFTGSSAVAFRMITWKAAFWAPVCSSFFLLKHACFKIIWKSYKLL